MGACPNAAVNSTYCNIFKKNSIKVGGIGSGFSLLLRHKATHKTFTGVAAAIPHALTPTSIYVSNDRANYTLINLHYFYCMEPKEFYRSRIVQLTAEKKKLQQRKSVFAVLRLGSIITVIAIFYFLWSINKFYAIAAAITTAAVFIQLIYRDLANREIGRAHV